MPVIWVGLLVPRITAAKDNTADKTYIPEQSHSIMNPEMNKKIDRTRQTLAILFFILSQQVVRRKTETQINHRDKIRPARSKCFGRAEAGVRGNLTKLKQPRQNQMPLGERWGSIPGKDNTFRSRMNVHCENTSPRRKELQQPNRTKAFGRLPHTRSPLILEE
jgi:hypothetical protein